MLEMLKPETWKEALIVAIWDRGGKANLHDLYEDAPRIRGGKVSDNYKSVINATLQAYSSDTDSYKSEHPDLFHCVEGKGRGVWGLRPEAEHVGYFCSEERLRELAIDSLTQADMKEVQGNSKPLRELLGRKQVEAELLQSHINGK